jgi:hypothetical protein
MGGQYTTTTINPPVALDEKYDAYSTGPGQSIGFSGGYETLDSTGNATGTRVWSLSSSYVMTGIGLVVEPPQVTEYTQSITTSTTPVFSYQRNINLTKSISSPSVFSRIRNISLTKSFSNASSSSLRRSFAKIIQTSKVSQLGIVKSVVKPILVSSPSLLSFIYGSAFFRNINITSPHEVYLNYPRTVEQLIEAVNSNSTELQKRIGMFIDYISSSGFTSNKIYGWTKILEMTSSYDVKTLRILPLKIFFSNSSSVDLSHIVADVYEHIISLSQPNEISIVRHIGKVLPFSSTSDVPLFRTIDKTLEMVSSWVGVIRQGNDILIDIFVESQSVFSLTKFNTFVKSLNLSSAHRIISPVQVKLTMKKFINKIGV